VPEWWDGKIEKPSDSDDASGCLASLVYVLILLALVAVIL
jgi:hypothetical protein